MRLTARAELMKFSPTGDTLWSRLGNNWSVSAQASSVRIGNRIFWTQGTKRDNNSLIGRLIGLDLERNTLFSKELPYAYANLCTYHDSLVLVSGATSLCPTPQAQFKGR